jgi:hypothetical protein
MITTELISETNAPRFVPEFFRLPKIGELDQYFGFTRGFYYEGERQGRWRLVRLRPKGKARGVTLVPYGEVLARLREAQSEQDGEIVGNGGGEPQRSLRTLAWPRYLKKKNAAAKRRSRNCKQGMIHPQRYGVNGAPLIASSLSSNYRKALIITQRRVAVVVGVAFVFWRSRQLASDEVLTATE